MSLKNSIILVCLLLSLRVAGTTYYIDPSGNNSNKGTSSSPWKSLSYACSKVTTPGDIIHINAGAYYETAQSFLSVGVSIEGAGNTSIIHSEVTSAHTLVLSSSSQGTSGNQSVSNIRMQGDMVAYGAILVDRRSNVTIHHCEFEDFFSRGILFSGAGFTSDEIPTVYGKGNSFHDNIVTNCADYQGSGKYGSALGNLEIGGEDGMVIYNNTITQKDRGPDDNGFCIKYCSNGYCKGLKIYNNTITKPTYDNSTWDFSIELWNSRGGIEIFNNRIQGGIDIGGNTSITNDQGGYGFAEKIYNNTLGFSSLQSVEENGIYVERGVNGGIYVYKNLIRNLTSAIAFYPGSEDIVKDIYFYSNVITDLGILGQSNFGNTMEWSTMDGSTNVTFENINFINNTIYGGTTGNPLSGLRFYFRGDASDIIVRNNIIQGFKACPVYMETTGSITNVSIENNIFYSNGNGNQPEYSPETPSNLTVQNNLISNPLFISLSDFHLQSTSPAIGKGLKISGITTDFDGNAVNNPPGIGAYEYYPPVPPAPPVYQSASIENTTPSLLRMTYDLTLKNVVPPSTAFNVQVNSVRRTVSTVEIKGNAVQLTLASPVVYNDIVTISYTAPSTNPIQTASGGVAKDIASKPVTNNCLDPTKPIVPPVVIINSPTNVYEGFIYELDASSTYAPSNEPLKVNWSIPTSLPISTTDSLKTKILAPAVAKETPLVLQLNVSDAISLETKSVTINVLPYKPDLVAAKFTEISASNFQLNYTPGNVADNDIKTYWSSNGDKQWLLLKLEEPFKISHLELAFQNIQSYFDILASKDNITWDPILTNVTSCKFSGEKQVFDFPVSNTYIEYRYIKYVGHGNYADTWNGVSDFKIFGTPHPPPVAGEAKIIVFPNPTVSMINISIVDQSIKPNKVRIIDSYGKILFEKILNPEDKNFDFEVNLRSGLYLLALASGNVILVTQKIVVKSQRN